MATVEVQRLFILFYLPNVYEFSELHKSCLGLLPFSRHLSHLGNSFAILCFLLIFKPHRNLNLLPQFPVLLPFSLVFL
jgi:hypothetical protein